MQPTQPLARALRRLALTPKNAGKDFYKGTRTGSMGWHTKYGGYRIDWDKVRTYKVPDLQAFEMTPFVSRRIKEVPSKFDGQNPYSGEYYLKAWKSLPTMYQY